MCVAAELENVGSIWVRNPSRLAIDSSIANQIAQIPLSVDQADTIVRLIVSQGLVEPSQNCSSAEVYVYIDGFSCFAI
jgi:hypothetical protein